MDRKWSLASKKVMFVDIWLFWFEVLVIDNYLMMVKLFFSWEETFAVI